MFAKTNLKIDFLSCLPDGSSKQRVQSSLPLQSFRRKVNVSQSNVSIRRHRTILFIPPQVSVDLTVAEPNAKQIQWNLDLTNLSI